MNIRKSLFFIAIATAITIVVPTAGFSTVWQMAFECSYWPPIFNMKNNINVTITTKDLQTETLPQSITQNDVSAYTISDGIYNTRTHRDCELSIENTDCAFELDLCPSTDSGQHAHLRAEFKETPDDAYSHYTLIINTSFQIMSYIHSEFLNDRGMSYSIENGYSICSGLTITQVSDTPHNSLNSHSEEKTSAENVDGQPEIASR